MAMLLLSPKEALLNYLCLIFLASYTAVVHADQWYITGNVSQNIMYDDNVFLTKDNPDGAIGYKLTPVINLGYQTERYNLASNLSYGLQRYLEIKKLDYNLQKYALMGEYNFTKRLTVGANTDYDISDSRQSSASILEDFSATSVRETQSASTFIDYKLTPLDNLKTSALYSKSSTQSETKITQVINKKFDLVWGHDWTERYSTKVTGFYSIYNADLTDSNTIGTNFFINYLWSETWEVFATTGGQVTESAKLSAGFLFDTGVKYQSQQLSTGISVARSLLPSNEGKLSEVDSLDFNLQYQFTYKLAASFSSSYKTTNSSGNETQSSSKKEFFNLQANINYQINPEWSVSASHQYRLQQQELIDSGGSNLFTFSLNYNWQGLQGLI